MTWGSVKYLLVYCLVSIHYKCMVKQQMHFKMYHINQINQASYHRNPFSLNPAQVLIKGLLKGHATVTKFTSDNAPFCANNLWQDNHRYSLLIALCLSCVDASFDMQHYLFWSQWPWPWNLQKIEFVKITKKLYVSNPLDKRHTMAAKLFSYLFQVKSYWRNKFCWKLTILYNDVICQ